MASLGQVVGGQHIKATVSTNHKGEITLQLGFKRLPKLTPDEVAKWEEVISDERGGVAGTVSAVGQAVAGAVLPGFVGKAASAALGAGLDSTLRPPRMVRVDWADGTQSLIKLPEKLFTHLAMQLKDQRVEPVEEDDALEPSSPVAISTLPVAQVDVMEQLGKLAALRDQGILTDEEFTAKKTDLLARL